MLFDCFAPIPSWREWYKATDQTPYYLWTKKILQVLQHQRGPQRWVLKSPQHLEQFHCLTETYPDGWFILTHRDPVSITASFCTMVTYSARMSQETVDAERFGRYWAGIIEDFLRAAVRDRDTLPSSRSVDVRFDEFMADDVATVARIYDWCGQPFTDGVRCGDGSVHDGSSAGQVGLGGVPPRRLRRSTAPNGATPCVSTASASASGTSTDQSPSGSRQSGVQSMTTLGRGSPCFSQRCM